METREERLKAIKAANAAGRHEDVDAYEVFAQILKNQLMIMERFNMTDVDTQVLLKRIENVQVNR